MNMMLAPVELARLPASEWEMQIEVWLDNGEISQKQARSLLKITEQWQKTGCPITFPKQTFWLMEAA